MHFVKNLILLAAIASPKLLASGEDLTSQATTTAAKPSHLRDTETSEASPPLVPTLLTLPNEILTDIADRLPFESAANFLGTCRLLHSIDSNYHIRLYLQSIFQIVCWQNNPEEFKLYVSKIIQAKTNTLHELRLALRATLSLDSQEEVNFNPKMTENSIWYPSDLEKLWVAAGSNPHLQNAVREISSQMTTHTLQWETKTTLQITPYQTRLEIHASPSLNEDDFVRALEYLKTASHLRYLKIESAITREQLQRLALILKEFRNLTSLHIENAGLEDQDMPALVELMVLNPRLLRLTLINNKIDNLGGNQLIGAFKNRIKLTDGGLYLLGNPFSNRYPNYPQFSNVEKHTWRVSGASEDSTLYVYDSRQRRSWTGEYASMMEVTSFPYGY